MWLKLDGENIINHEYDNNTDGTGWDVQTDEKLIFIDKRKYAQKWVDGQLVDMTQPEIESHPILVAEAEEKAKKDKAKEGWSKLSKDEQDELMYLIVETLFGE